MPRLAFSSLIMFICSITAHAQTWHEQNINDEFTVSFPVPPEHYFIDSNGREAYMCYDHGCTFMAGIDPNILNNYKRQIENASDSDRLNIKYALLESAAESKVKHNDQHFISLRRFHQGKNIGIELEYATKDPSDPMSRKRFTELVLIKNVLYLFDCWYLDERNHEKEREAFFKSIILKSK